MTTNYIKEIYSIFKNSSGISIDTRTIKNNSIYFALKGPSFNGNDFAREALEKGAKLVYSIDVGTDQLHEKLKNDKRVFDISSTDIRAIRSLNIPTPDLLVVDLSFISLTVALPIIMLTVPSKTKMICLIKPQFELSKKSLNKNGVVKKDEYIEEVINKIKDFMKAIKWQVIGIKKSPIRGRSGNKEFLLYASKGI